MISAEGLITKFQQALDEGWGYIWGTAGKVWTAEDQRTATREMTVKYGSRWIGRMVADCSGLFVWAFKQFGESIYHGSNSIWNQSLSARGELQGGKRTDGQALKLGTAVFIHKAGTDDRSHIGLYIGDKWCIEAQGTQTGVVKSKIDRWDEWGELRKVDYSQQAAPDNGNTAGMIPAIVKTDNGGGVNIRRRQSASAEYLGKIPEDTAILVRRDYDYSEWCYTEYNGVKGYVMTKFLDFGDGGGGQQQETGGAVTLRLDAETARALARALKECGV